MKEKILNSLDSPNNLEELYRKSPESFAKAFAEIYSDISNKPLAEFWKVRLNFEYPDLFANSTALNIAREKFNFGKSKDKLYLIFSLVISIIIAKYPQIYTSLFDKPVDSESFYARNFMFVIFGLPILYVLLKQNLKNILSIFVTLTLVLLIIYFNALSCVSKDAQALSFLCLPFFLSYLGLIARENISFLNPVNRKNYIIFYAETFLSTPIIFLSLILAVSILFALLSLIFSKATNQLSFFYLTLGLFSSSIAIFIVENNPGLVKKFLNILSFLLGYSLSASLIIFLLFLPFAEQNPFKNRDYLIGFNAAIIVILLIILYILSYENINSSSKKKIISILIFSFSAILFNFIGLSAVFFRINEWGITPNRIFVIITNILVFIHLILIMIFSIKLYIKSNECSKSAKLIFNYLDIYALWFLFVIFVFPKIFK